MVKLSSLEVQEKRGKGFLQIRRRKKKKKSLLVIGSSYAEIDTSNMNIMQGGVPASDLIQPPVNSLETLALFTCSLRIWDPKMSKQNNSNPRRANALVQLMHF